MLIGSIVSSVICVIVMIIIMKISENEERYGTLLLTFLVMISFCVSIVCGKIHFGNDGEKNGYKQGQVDAINGIIKYEKTENQVIEYIEIDEK